MWETDEEITGVIAQLGERYNGIVEVGGSIPPGSTNFVRELKLNVPYTISLLLFLPSCFGVFHTKILKISNTDSLIYIKMASVFVAIVAFILCWYFSNLIIHRDVINRVHNFGFSLIKAGLEKIAQNRLQELTEELIENFEKYEACRLELLGFCLPFFTISATLLAFGMYQNWKTFPAYSIGYSLSTIVVMFSNSISNRCSIALKQRSLQDVLRNLSTSVRSIQYYDSKQFVQSKIFSAEQISAKTVKAQSTRSVWQSFTYTCVIFFMIVIAYIINKEYILTALFSIKDAYATYFASLFFFTLFVITWRRWQYSKNIIFEDISKYQGAPENIEYNEKIDTQNIFIAFHGVYFQEPTHISNKPLIADLSFSVLPGEFITITGENTLAQEYIFDLLLRFYKPQSGQIYIAGTKIENIPKKQMRSTIGIFEENFGLIHGSVYDNLTLAENNRNRINTIITKIGLEEYVDDLIYSPFGELNIPQEARIRLQIARIMLTRPRVLLIKTPHEFDSADNEQLFYDFVNYARKKYTVMLITNEVTSMVYSSKILYLGKDENLFGTHAELAKNKSYQNYITKI